MKIRRWNINAIFWLACGLLLAGCKTTEQKRAEKDQTLISLHLETNPDGSPRNMPVPIYRSRPVMVNVMLDPLLTNENIEKADLVDVEGGWAIRLKFKDQGIRSLEITSMRYRGKRLAVRAAFPQLRWLAAPVLTHRIEDGVFIFTPDATREEAERIVRGINNANKKITRNQLMK